MSNQKKSGGNPVGAAVGWAMVGAGIAAAGAAVLKDKLNRDKVEQGLTDAKDGAIGYMKDMKKQAQGKKGEVEEKFAEGKKKVKMAVTSAKDRLRKELKKEER